MQPGSESDHPASCSLHGFGVRVYSVGCGRTESFSIHGASSSKPCSTAASGTWSSLSRKPSAPLAAASVLPLLLLSSLLAVLVLVLLLLGLLAFLVSLLLLLGLFAFLVSLLLLPGLLAFLVSLLLLLLRLRGGLALPSASSPSAAPPPRLARPSPACPCRPGQRPPWQASARPSAVGLPEVRPLRLAGGASASSFNSSGSLAFFARFALPELRQLGHTLQQTPLSKQLRGSCLRSEVLRRLDSLVRVLLCQGRLQELAGLRGEQRLSRKLEGTPGAQAFPEAGGSPGPQACPEAGGSPRQAQALPEAGGSPAGRASLKARSARARPPARSAQGPTARRPAPSKLQTCPSAEGSGAACAVC